MMIDTARVLSKMHEELTHELCGRPQSTGSERLGHGRQGQNSNALALIK